MYKKNNDLWKDMVVGFWTWHVQYLDFPRPHVIACFIYLPPAWLLSWGAPKLSWGRSKLREKSVRLVSEKTLFGRERVFLVVSIFDALSYKTDSWGLRFKYFPFYFRRTDCNQSQAIFGTIQLVPLLCHIFTFFIIPSLRKSHHCNLLSQGWVEFFWVCTFEW